MGLGYIVLVVIGVFAISILCFPVFLGLYLIGVGIGCLGIFADSHSRIAGLLGLLLIFLGIFYYTRVFPKLEKYLKKFPLFKHFY